MADRAQNATILNPPVRKCGIRRGGKGRMRPPCMCATPVDGAGLWVRPRPSGIFLARQNGPWRSQTPPSFATGVAPNQIQDAGRTCQDTKPDRYQAASRAVGNNSTPRDRTAQTLLRQMLRAGVSRFDPDPLMALRQASRRKRSS